MRSLYFLDFCYRQGNGLELSADDGEGPNYRATLSPIRHNTLLHVHSQEGVVIGGRPEYGMDAVHRDYFDGGQLFPKVLIQLNASFNSK